MNLLRLNCRGLGNPDAVSGLRDLLRREAPAMVFLCETKLCGHEMRKVRLKFEDYAGMEVDSVGRLGGLAFMWRKDIQCDFKSASVHHMDFVITKEGREWRVTGFYEMKGGSRPQRQMNNFRDAVDECGLRDVPFEGYPFTFDNGQAEDANRQCRLDRALCTSTWTDLFPYAKLRHLGREWSDHTPIKLIFDARSTGDRGGKLFRFEQLWVGEDGCEEAVRRGWENGVGDIVEALSDCAAELVKWKGVNVAELAELRRQEEVFWRQRSRAIWLKEGDRNTKFFHQRASQRKRKNHIAKIIDEHGLIREGQEAVGEVAMSYFQNLFRSSRPTNFEDTLEGIEGRVTPRMNMILSSEYRAEEVVEALQQMHPMKAPGPDGMNGLFFQTYWSVVGPLVMREVLGILRGTRSAGRLNKTHIVLIPKKKAPDKMSDYRPISLCNVVYKLVSKVLANRLKVFLGDVVSENQSAFTPGRQITDNTLIAFEIFHHMKNSRSREGHMAIKLDMAKAYDRIEWTFLDRVLRVMGFETNWVERVMDCVQSVSFAVLINGTPTDEFRPTRGLRQGDPLSPYLFILCAEVLSSLIRREIENGALHGVRIATQAPIISHLFFADDSILFVKANEEEASRVLEVLRRYEGASGQLVSLEKTTVSFSKGVSTERRNHLAEVLGVAAVEAQEKYLGLPTVIGRSKKALPNILRDKLSKKLQGWYGKTLSRAGREVLIKAIAQSIPTYIMRAGLGRKSWMLQCDRADRFKRRSWMLKCGTDEEVEDEPPKRRVSIPSSFCNEIRSLISQFWWGSDGDKRKIAWVAWKRLCQPKCRGGMGFRDMEKFNSALLGKQAWRLLTHGDTLWARLMKARYYVDGSYLEAGLGHNPSYTWRDIWEAKGVVKKGMRRRIGDGASTFVWKDPWILGSHSGYVISPCVGNEDIRVAELLNEASTNWDMSKLEGTFLPFEVTRISNIRLSERRPRDSWFWVGEKDGVYSVRSAYRLIMEEGEEETGQSDWSREQWVWNKIWRAPIWPRIKIFCWQMCREAIATRGNLRARGGCEDATCPMWGGSAESLLHLFRGCGWTGRVWDGLGLEEESHDGFERVREWVEARIREVGEDNYVRFLVGCWAIWEGRNKRVFEDKDVDAGVVVRRVWEVEQEMERMREEEGKRVDMGMGRAARQREGESWLPPTAGRVKINGDAASKEEVGVGVGIVCRDEKGECLWGVSNRRNVVWEPRLAEAVAVLEGLQEAKRRNHRHIVMESDCLQLIEDIRSSKEGRNDYFLVIDDIRFLCNDFDSIAWTFVRRTGNYVAHFLAHYEPNVLGRRDRTSGLPPSAAAVMYADFRSMN
ncbi:uncharacterized protein LOC141601617 [Silene latifolia]|uniref:uncharacterized protein LOC141601617 n=1 Tax=Silene latifolia TaxID=37657 RepID=UPI003D776669